VMNLAFIARHLGKDRPFYGVQARGVDGLDAPFTSIRDMARAYLVELRQLSPSGPYWLSGYCGGGIVAYEMARLLRHAGEEVAFLGLIDTYRPGSVQLPRLDWLSNVRASIEGLGYLVQQTKRGLLRNKDELARRLALNWYRATQQPIPHELRGGWLTDAFFKAARKYRTRPYDGELVVFRAREAHPALAATSELGWAGLASTIAVHEVPGDHATLAQEPNATVLGGRLLRILNEHERQRGGR
jgi:thioesterase domain-containing protein